MNNKINASDVAAMLIRTYKTLFRGAVNPPGYKNGVIFGSWLEQFIESWEIQARNKPEKEHNGAAYASRVRFWFRDGNLPFFDTRDMCLVMSGNRTNINHVHVDGRDIHGQTFKVPLENVLPIFSSYYPGRVSPRELYEGLREALAPQNTHRETVDDIDGFTGSGAAITAASWSAAPKSHELTKESKKETQTMSKLQSAVSNVATTGKNSFGKAAGITAGNATNAVVKAAMRPALEPALRKLLQPKGLLQRTLGKGKVDDSVEAIMNSPLMDILAATLLVSITSSGMIKNEKLVKGSELASDAAMLKIFNLIDFDAVVQNVTEKVTGIVSTLEGEADKAE